MKAQYIFSVKLRIKYFRYNSIYPEFGIIKASFALNLGNPFSGFSRSGNLLRITLPNPSWFLLWQSQFCPGRTKENIAYFIFGSCKNHSFSVKYSTSKIDKIINLS